MVGCCCGVVSLWCYVVLGVYGVEMFCGVVSILAFVMKWMDEVDVEMSSCGSCGLKQMFDVDNQNNVTIFSLIEAAAFGCP